MTPERADDRVVIVGAGLCGLVAAFELQQQGIQSVVLESNDCAGGRVRTITFPDGATAEAGMEEFWSTSPADELLRRLDVPRIEEPAWSSVMLDGRLSAYSAADSESYFEHLFAGSARADFARWNEHAWRILDEFDASGASAGRRLAAPAIDFASFVDALHLPPRLRSWIRVYVETESAIEWNRISAIDGLHEIRPFLTPRDQTNAPFSVRVSGGNIGLVDALLARLAPGTVRLGARVASVSTHPKNPVVDVGYTTTDGRSTVVRGHHALLTAPIWSLGSIRIEPQIEEPSRRAIASTRFGSYVKVVVRVRPDRVSIWESEGHDPFTLLTDGPAGCIYLTDGRPTDRDHVLTALVHGRYARALNGRSQGHVIRRTISALERLDVTDACGQRGTGRALLHGLRSAVTAAVVFDHPRAVAYWPHDRGRSRFDALADDLRRPHGRILIGGDTTESSHSDGAVRSGIRMAHAIAERLPAHGTVSS